MNEKKTISKSMIIILSIMMIFNITVSAESNIKTTLSLEEAIRIGIENSPQIELNRINLEKLKVELSEARSEERSYGKRDPFDRDYQMLAGTEGGFLLEEEAKSKSKEFQIEQTNMKEEYIKNNLESGVTGAYYGVLQTKDGVDIQKATLVNLQRNYEIVKKQLELGISSKSELYMTEISLNEGIVNFSKAENNYKRTLRGLNNILNYPLDTQLNLTSDYKENDSSIDLNKDLEYAFENRYDLIIQQNTKEILDLNFKVTKQRYTPNTYRYKYAESDVKEMEFGINEHKKKIEADIKAKYDEIKTAKEEIRLMDSNIQKAKEGLRLSKLSYELGTGTSLEVNEAIIMLNSAELGKSNAVSNYNTSLLEYDRSVNIGQIQ